MRKKTTSQYCNLLNAHTEGLYYQALLNAPVPIMIIQEDGRFLLINSAVQKSTGFIPEEISTVEAWSKFTQTDSVDSIDAYFRLFFQAEIQLAPLRISVKNKSGNRLIWELFNAPLGHTEQGQRMAICIVSDITEKINHERHLEEIKIRLEREVAKRTMDLNVTISALENEIVQRKHMSDALAISRDSLRQLSRRTLTVLEADRRTISKELHDSLGASLAAIKFSLEDKELKRTQNNGHLDDSLNQEIAYLMTTIKETKRISANLRPTILDDLGLMATIKWYIRQFRKMYNNIRIEYTTNITEGDVPEPMQIIIYRLIQEGLSNAGKHSEASRVRLWIEFSKEKPAISLFIEDDGRGFNVKEVLSQKDPLSGYGLIAMRERCEIFGGTFHIESHIGKGSKINAVLPILT